jgi:hypothetical protein
MGWDMADFSRHTPWGYADQYENLGQGVFSVSTPSHGGIFVPECMLHNIPEEQQAWAERWSGSRQWYEEDCCWAAVAVALPDRFPDGACQHAERILAHYFPATATA